jgi:hypothetical protein
MELFLKIVLAKKIQKQKHPKNIQKTSKKHPKNIQEKHPRKTSKKNIQEKHPDTHHKIDKKMNQA